jgi:hypothetical protein
MKQVLIGTALLVGSIAGTATASADGYVEVFGVPFTKVDITAEMEDIDLSSGNGYGVAGRVMLSENYAVSAEFAANRYGRNGEGDDNGEGSYNFVGELTTTRVGLERLTKAGSGVNLMLNQYDAGSVSLYGLSLGGRLSTDSIKGFRLYGNLGVHCVTSLKTDDADERSDEPLCLPGWDVGLGTEYRRDAFALSMEYRQLGFGLPGLLNLSFSDVRLGLRYYY